MINFEEKMKKNIWWSFFVAIFLILFALILLLKADDIISTVILVVGFLGIFLGGLHFIQYLRMEKSLRIFSNDLAEGVILLFFGGIALLKNVVLADIVTYLIGAYLIYSNALRIQICFYLGDKKEKNSWKYFAIVSILGVILGTLIILNPFENVSSSIVIAYCVLISEILNLFQNIPLLIGFGHKNETKE